ncbi:unnamed protein product [Darwinula stevensoni]|uniref:CARD domain-containing protein n=1 Tax=Darwinula stevensoni TaxID=69355 RepID=A0A7R9FRG4_9CRUS|nr:unnamed protein product [Darwinula stevensoni]CAG0901355.1 unnamed protein product [Darwinula stevensoni]
MAASQVIAKFTTELEYVDIDRLLQELWKEGVIKPQPYFQARNKPFEEKLSFVQLQLSIGGEDVFPTFLECLRTLKYGQLASAMEAEWKKKGGKGPTESGNTLPSNGAPQASGISKPDLKPVDLDDIRRVKDVMKDRNVVVKVDLFVDVLVKKRLLSVVEEKEIRETRGHNAKIDAIFDILLELDAEEVYEKLIDTFKEMKRNDIIKKIQGA